MDSDWQRVAGIVRQGHRVASGTGADRRYPAGTLTLQRPFFAALGFDLSPYHDGTLNVDVAPRTFALARPAHTFRRVEWTHLHPPEDFSFSRCAVVFGGREFAGWVYTPHPETKAAHFQPPSLLEILAPRIPDIRYGDAVEVRLPAAEIVVT